MWGVFHRAAELVVSDQHIEVFATRPTQSGQLTRRRCSITFAPPNILGRAKPMSVIGEKSGRHLLVLSVSQFDPKRSPGYRASSTKLMAYQNPDQWASHGSARWSAGEARAAGRSASRRKDDFARESFGAPVEAHFALQLTSNHAVQHARAEAMTHRWLDRRATGLGPAKNEASV
jgi:hypothetical protein